MQRYNGHNLAANCFLVTYGTLMTANDGMSRTRKVYYYRCFNHKIHKKQCNKNNITKDKLEDLVFDKMVEYVLQPSIIDKLALAVMEKLNKDLQKSDMLALLKKEQKQDKK